MKKRFVLFASFLVCTLLVLLVQFNFTVDHDADWEEKRLCYLPLLSNASVTDKPGNGLVKAQDLLPDISQDQHPPKPSPGRSIFFHETSCSLDNKVALNARQACAIESAAKLNPGRDVFVLFASPRLRLDPSHVPAFVRVLSEYKNIHLRNANIWTYSQGTLVDEWIQENVLFTSNYVQFHMSDFMRYLSLNKYRGVYLDMDVIVLKDFDALESANFAGAESSEDVAAGIISLDDTSFGRQVSQLCLRDFKYHFSGQAWGNNGPGVITRVLEKICATSDTTIMQPSRCHGFSVLPPHSCYAVPYRQWAKFFDPQLTSQVLDTLKDSVIAHFWNKFSIKLKVRVGDGSAYDVLAKEHCPRVYASVGEYF